MISMRSFAALILFVSAACGPVFAQEPAGGYPYQVEIVTEADEDLRGEIEARSLLLERVETPPASANELVSRALEDTARITAVLYTRGYYGGVVTVRIAGQPAAEPDTEAAIAGALASGPIPVTITVEPGPQFTFGEIRIEGIEGIVEIDPESLRLVPGATAFSDVILQAEAEIVRRLRDEGLPLAGVPRRDVVADHATSRLDVTLFVVPGGRATLGAVEVLGTDKVDSGLVARLAPFEPGTPYHPAILERYRDRLRSLPIFASAVVRTGDAIAPDGSIPVIVEVSERPPRIIGAGAFWSTDEGVAVNAYWGHRNLFGHAENFRIEGEVGGLLESEWQDFDYRLALTFEKPAVPTARDDLLAAMSFTRETTDAFTRLAAEASVGFRRRLTDTLTLEASVAFEATEITDTIGTAEYLLLSLPVTAEFDNTDSALDPTEGYRWTIEAEPIWDINNSRLITVFSGEVSAYFALDEAAKYVLAGRVGMGTIIGAPVDDIPASRRFYAGGGGSVRGYAFQSVSPRAPDDSILGGLSLFEASLEARIRVTDTIGIVPFIDAGAAFKEAVPDFGGLKFGAGVGLRYQTPIGPIRVDVAVPLNPGPNDDSFGIYVGLGQAF